MPEYLAPGVFVEEVSFRQQSIEGVSTSTTAFVGPTRFGPVDGEPPLLTSFADFQRIYGGLDPLRIGGEDVPNYLAHAVRAYFDEGGKRLHVARAYNPSTGSPPLSGHAIWPETPASPDFGFAFRARHPGRAGNLRVDFAFRLGENVLHPAEGGLSELRGAQNHDVVMATEPGSPTPAPVLYRLERYLDAPRGRETFRLLPVPGGSPAGPVELEDLTAGSELRVLTVNALVRMPGRFSEELAFLGLRLHPAHPNALSRVFAEVPDRRATVLLTPLVMTSDHADGAALAEAMLRLGNAVDGTTIGEALAEAVAARTIPSDAAITARLALSGGDDGDAPGLADYSGQALPPKSGLAAIEDLEDVSIVAAPGATAEATTGRAVMRALIGHAERMRYRVAVLDSEPEMLPADIRAMRAEIDSTRAALYYPWVVIDDPLSDGPPSELLLPPSGFMAGIYARTDVSRGVHKSPANEVVRLARGFEFQINARQQEALNPEGINCLRFFEGRGFRVWGARTVSSVPEWTYLSVRRYFAYLERSIEKGTQWAVFEPNGPRLWTNVQRTVEDFLYNEFVSNRLLGRKPAQAFFVRCDETTMTQNDLDNGRLICLVGVAPLRPAEFVIFRIGQKTADATG